MLLDKLYRSFWNGVDAKDKKRVDAEIMPEGISGKLNIPYIADGKKEHLLDVFYPENATFPLPLIIDIHGGGLMGGTKLGNRPYCYHLAKRGFVVIAMDYSLAPEHRYPASLLDVNQAMFWIKEHAPEFGADMNNVFLTGDSAGGFLALHECFVNYDKRVADLYDLASPNFGFRAIGLTSGMYDLDKGFPVVMFPGIFGTWKKKKAPFFDKLDPSLWVKKDNIPPCYMVTSEEDFIQFSTLKLDKILTEKGIYHKLHNFEKREGEKLEHVFSVLKPSTPSGTECIDEMVAFFREYIQSNVKEA